MNKTKMDWLALELRLRQVLKTAKEYTELSNKCDTRYDIVLLLQEVSDILGQETGRGYELPNDWHKTINERDEYSNRFFYKD
jgi:hypothetical protein